MFQYDGIVDNTHGLVTKVTETKPILGSCAHYMYTKTEGFPSPNFAILSTPHFAVTGPTCRLQFWYNIDGTGKIGSLDVSYNCGH